jgi:multisubunit Na+/H+ antiporter MnhF subunit
MSEAFSSCTSSAGAARLRSSTSWGSDERPIGNPMNEWQLAAAVLGAAILPCLAVCTLTEVMPALAALELSGTLLASSLMALCEGLHRQPFADLALAFAILSMIGALAFARLMERDL